MLTFTADGAAVLVADPEQARFVDYVNTRNFGRPAGGAAELDGFGPGKHHVHLG
jgi:hypothetical protein